MFQFQKSHDKLILQMRKLKLMKFNFLKFGVCVKLCKDFTLDLFTG
jgi:hypothetical protein